MGVPPAPNPSPHPANDPGPHKGRGSLFWNQTGGGASPQLVTFNGNSFDLPVLRYRAMVHGVSAPGLSTRPYFHRYTEDAIDLCDVFSSFSPQGKATLHEISRVMGLPGKPKGFDGGEVERYFHEGKIKEIAESLGEIGLAPFRRRNRYPRHHTMSRAADLAEPARLPQLLVCPSRLPCAQAEKRF
jgi:predicted 3'-5' exonuclease similar to PolB exonuclease domain